MKKINSIITILIASILITACSTSDNVVSDNIIQKRKYNKGFHLNIKQKSNQTNIIESEDLASNDKKSNTIIELINSDIDEKRKETSDQSTITASASDEVFSAKIDIINIDDRLPNNVENKITIHPKVERIQKRDEKRIEKSLKRNFIADIIDGFPDDLLFLLLIFLVPFGTTISMFLYEGSTWTDRVTINLILTLLFWIPGMIHALIIIFGKK